MIICLIRSEFSRMVFDEQAAKRIDRQMKTEKENQHVKRIRAFAHLFMRVTFQFHLLPHYDILSHLYLCVTH